MGGKVKGSILTDHTGKPPVLSDVLSRPVTPTVLSAETGALMPNRVKSKADDAAEERFLKRYADSIPMRPSKSADKPQLPEHQKHGMIEDSEHKNDEGAP